MPNPSVVGFSGNFGTPSKTRGFVEYCANEIAARQLVEAATFAIDDIGPSLGAARWARDLDDQGRKVLDAVVSAELLVVGSPTYKAATPGCSSISST